MTTANGNFSTRRSALMALAGALPVAAVAVPAAAAGDVNDETIAAKIKDGTTQTRAALNGATAEATERVAPVSVMDFKGSGVSDDDALHAAIVKALTRNPASLKENRTVYLPAGVYRITRNRFFSDFDFTKYGLSNSVRQGVRFVGDGRQATTLLLETGGVEKWLYDNQSISTQKFQDLTFEHLTLTTDDPERGNGFKMWSQGGEKKFRFLHCGIELGVVMQTEGTGNADLNRFINCLITANRAVFVLNNPQSVANGLLGSDVTCRRDMVVIRAGGSFWMEHGNLEMHNDGTTDTADHFILNNPVAPTNAAGNADFNITDVRMELRGANKKLVRTTSDSGQLNINFTRLQTGTVSGGPREAVLVTGTKRVRFDNCILHQDLTYRSSSSSTSTPMGAVIQFRDCDTGRGSLLSTRCTITGDSSRIIADGCYRQNSDIVQGTVEPEDFDFGWRTAQVRNVPPTAKITQIKRRGQLLPIAGSATGNPRVTLPAGAWIKRIYVYKRPVTGSTGNYQLHIGPEGRRTRMASSAAGTIATAQTIDVADYGVTPATTLELWATGTTGINIGTGGDETIAYIEYI